MSQHPFAGRWNHNSQLYPLVGQLIAGHEVVLDVGCGDGTLANYLAGLGHQVVGVDADPNVLAPDSPTTHFMLGDATGLPFGNDQFDAVVAVMVLHHTDAQLALVEMRRVLRPGGQLVLIGYGKDRNLADLARSGADVIKSAWQSRGKTKWQPQVASAKAMDSWAQSRKMITTMLEGAHWRRVGAWRYLVTWRRG